MGTLTLGFPWFGEVRLSAKAVVIGAVALAFGTAQVAHAGINVWTSHGPYGGGVTALAINPTTPSTLYAGTYGGGVFQSTNSGGSWSAVNDAVNNGLADLNVDALAIDPTTPSTLYAGTNGGAVYQSTNSGGSWRTNGVGMVSVLALAINPTTPSTLYAGTWGAGVFQSTNSGGSWGWASTGLIDLNPSVSYPNVRALAINPTTPSTLYAGTSGGGVFQSTNSAGSWSAVKTGLSGYALDVGALAIDPTTPSTLYAGTNGGGVFQSTNSGGSWSAVNTGLSNLGVSALAINPTTPSTLYAGTGGGVFQSTNSAGSWRAVDTTGLGNQFVWALAIDPTTPSTLYAGTAGGAFDIELLCGNGALDSGEQCDDGAANGASGSCCNSNCTFTSAGTVCRPSAGACDVAEVCTGSSGTCPADHNPTCTSTPTNTPTPTPTPTATETPVFIPGGGPVASDCTFEWATDPGPLPGRNGLPATRLDCTDGDPSCDFDGTAGTCTFHVALCFNVQDPRIACSPTNVQIVQVLQPAPGRAGTTDTANRSALETALGQVGGYVQGVCTRPVIHRGQFCTAPGDCNSAPGTADGVCLSLVKFSPALAATNMCTGYAPITVPVRHTARRDFAGTKRLRIIAAPSVSSPTLRDTDSLTLICRPHS